MACNCGKRRQNSATSANYSASAAASAASNGSTETAQTSYTGMSTPQPSARERLARRRDAARERVALT